jgi:hypothetical protein
MRSLFMRIRDVVTRLALNLENSISAKKKRDESSHKELLNMQSQSTDLSHLDDPEEIAAWQKHRERQRIQSLPRKSAL